MEQVLLQTGSTKKADAVEGRTVAFSEAVAAGERQSLVGSNSPFFGVNLAGWLVRERWLWPVRSDFLDEWTFIQAHGGSEAELAKRETERHWDSFVRRDHLADLRAFGVTHVRVPVGYWLVDYNASDGFVDGGERYLRRLLRWCKDLDIKVLVDLHALPGCQAGGQSFCGKTEPRAGFLIWGEHYRRGKRAILRLAELIRGYEHEAATAGVIVGMGLCNEPERGHLDGYPGVYDLVEHMVPQIRAILPADYYLLLLSFTDPPSLVAPWLEITMRRNGTNYKNVAFDKHLFHNSGDDSHPDYNTNTCKTCCRNWHVFEPLTRRGIPIVIGEWSLTSGRGGDGDLDRHFSEQLSLWANTPRVLGSFFWNFRLPQHSTEWSLLSLMNEAVLTRPDEVDVSRLCPEQDLCRCPAFPNSDGPEWRRWPPPTCNMRPSCNEEA